MWRFSLKKELEDAGIKFVFADLPEANNTMILGVMASIAQYEAELISKRTKAGLAEAKKKGKQIGSPQNLTDEAKAKAHRSISEKADQIRLTDTLSISSNHGGNRENPIKPLQTS